ncbi:protein sec, partial [Chrysochromulina tobinii]
MREPLTPDTRTLVLALETSAAAYASGAVRAYCDAAVVALESLAASELVDSETLLTLPKHTPPPLSHVSVALPALRAFLERLAHAAPRSADASSAAAAAASSEADRAALPSAVNIVLQLLDGMPATLLLCSASGATHGAAKTTRRMPERRVGGAPMMPSAIVPGALGPPPTDADAERAASFERLTRAEAPQIRDLARKCLAASVTVHLCLAPARDDAFVDAASLAPLAWVTGGEWLLADEFGAPAGGRASTAEPATARVSRWVERSIAQRPAGTEGVFRVRTSAGLKVTNLISRETEADSTVVNLPSAQRDTTLALELAHASTPSGSAAKDKSSAPSAVLSADRVFIQTALLYTAPDGGRRIRVLTRPLRVLRDEGTLLRTVHPPAVAALLAKRCAERLATTAASKVAELVQEECAALLLAMRPLCPPPLRRTETEILLTKPLELLPLLTLAILKLPPLALLLVPGAAREPLHKPDQLVAGLAALGTIAYGSSSVNATGSVDVSGSSMAVHGTVIPTAIDWMETLGVHVQAGYGQFPASLTQGTIAYGSSSVDATGTVDVSGSSMAVHGTVIPTAIDWMETLGVHVQADYGQFPASLTQGTIAYGSSSVDATGTVDVSGSSMAVHGTVIPTAIDWMETLGVHVQAEYGDDPFAVSLTQGTIAYGSSSVNATGSVDVSSSSMAVHSTVIPTAIDWMETLGVHVQAEYGDDPYAASLTQGTIAYGSSSVNATGTVDVSGSSMAVHGTVIPTAIDWMETLGVQVQAEYGDNPFAVSLTQGTIAYGSSSVNATGSVDVSSSSMAVHGTVIPFAIDWMETLGVHVQAEYGDDPFAVSLTQGTIAYGSSSVNATGSVDVSSSSMAVHSTVIPTAIDWMETLGVHVQAEYGDDPYAASLTQGTIAYGSSSVNATGTVDVSGSSMAVHGTVIPTAIDWMETLGVHVHAEYGADPFAVSLSQGTIAYGSSSVDATGTVDVSGSSMAVHGTVIPFAIDWMETLAVHGTIAYGSSSVNATGTVDVSGSSMAVHGTVVPIAIDWMETLGLHVQVEYGADPFAASLTQGTIAYGSSSVNA